MPLPDLRTFCIDVDAVPGDVCVTFPGGAEVCVSLPSASPPTLDELMRQLFAQVNTALAPLTPIFNIIDAVVAVFDCVKAISTLNPQEILNCIPNLAEKVAELLNLIPQVSLVALVADVIELLILYFKGIRNQIIRQQLYYQRILAAQLAAAEPGNASLARVLPCARDDLDQLLNWQNQSAAPVNRLIGVINLFLEIIGLSRFKIPAGPSLTVEDLENTDIIQLIDLTIELLTYVRLAIPIPPSQALIGDVLEELGFT